MATATAKPNFMAPLPGRKPSGKAAVCNRRERAVAGYTRFKVRATFPPHQEGKYILAVDEAAARQEYLKVMRLEKLQSDLNTLHAAWREEVKKNAFLPEPECVQLVVTELDD